MHQEGGCKKKPESPKIAVSDAQKGNRAVDPTQQRIMKAREVKRSRKSRREGLGKKEGGSKVGQLRRKHPIGVPAIAEVDAEVGWDFRVRVPSVFGGNCEHQEQLYDADRHQQRAVSSDPFTKGGAARGGAEKRIASRQRQLNSERAYSAMRRRREA